MPTQTLRFAVLTAVSTSALVGKCMVNRSMTNSVNLVRQRGGNRWRFARR